ncbi:MAG: helix-turn-helix transcriptional regulator [Armatimonadota bacterium]|nr:helix-turn-helix transcriptional regulator [Armatimonadota bacterium]
MQKRGFILGRRAKRPIQVLTGTIIRGKRKIREGLTMAILAERVGIQLNTLADIEKERVIVTQEEYKRIWRAMGMVDPLWHDLPED